MIYIAGVFTGLALAFIAYAMWGGWSRMLAALKRWTGVTSPSGSVGPTAAAATVNAPAALSGRIEWERQQELLKTWAPLSIEELREVEDKNRAAAMRALRDGHVIAATARTDVANQASEVIRLRERAETKREDGNG